MSPWTPKFVKTYAALHETLREAAKAYASEVVEGSFPEEKHTFSS